MSNRTRMASNLELNVGRERLKPVDSSRSSYCLNTLYRIETMSKAINETRRLVDETKCQLETQLQRMQEGQDYALRVQKAQGRVLLLQEQLASGRVLVQQLRDQLINVASEAGEGEANIECCERISLRFERMKRDKLQLRSKQERFFEKKTLLHQYMNTLMFRRRRLAGDLLSIFPLVPFPDNRGGFSILGIYLPNADCITAHDDLMVEAAIGYLCQMLIVLSRLFDIPLRYDILFHGSANWIVDRVTTESYPLFAKNSRRDRARFEQGGYLLNRNVAQMREHFGLPTADIRLTLFNLYSLFRERLLLSKEELARVRGNGSGEVDWSFIEIVQDAQKLVQSNQNSLAPGTPRPKSTRHEEIEIANEKISQDSLNCDIINPSFSEAEENFVSSKGNDTLDSERNIGQHEDKIKRVRNGSEIHR